MCLKKGIFKIKFDTAVDVSKFLTHVKFIFPIVKLDSQNTLSTCVGKQAFKKISNSKFGTAVDVNKFLTPI